jgi:SAM-dependent methyltransferase
MMMAEKDEPSHALTYDRIVADLRQAYDREAQGRQERGIASWKVAERDHFLSLLKREGKETLLEIGAGPGKYGKFFQDNGLSVICTDLSPEMVRLCRDKGLTAYAMDFLSLDFPEASFDAVFALNCLLHVPGQDLPRVLRTIRTVLKPAGLFYLGQYGGKDEQGIWRDDFNEPKRFFCSHTDDRMQQIAAAYFDLVSFQPVPVLRHEDPAMHFQSLILRRAR